MFPDDFLHVFSSFAPEISTDASGFDSWADQGTYRNPSCCDPNLHLPNWLQHTMLKSPWLYAQKSTPNPHVAYSDIGDLKFISVDGHSCPILQEHPSLILNTLASKVHVKLDDVSNSVRPRTMWDSTYSLKNSAPGGNGSKIVSYQNPVAGEKSDEFMSFCYKSVHDLRPDTEFKLTVESKEDPNDVSIKPWKDEIILRPRPMCDAPVSSFLS
jgi:hypothetical protein